MDRDRRRAALTESDERAQERQREAATRLDKLRERQARTRQLIQLGSVCVARGFTDADELGAFFDSGGGAPADGGAAAGPGASGWDNADGAPAAVSTTDTALLCRRPTA